MTNYRRIRLFGGTYFFTVVIVDRHLDILVKHIQHLKASFRDECENAPFTNLGFVILPDHLHTIWRLPQGDSDYSNRWRHIKADFSRRLAVAGAVSNSRECKGERGIWQRRFWEHTVRDEEDFQRHLDYIHFNPVKHGLVSRVSDWPHSSFHEYVRRGVYTPGWGGCGGIGEGEYGE